MSTTAHHRASSTSSVETYSVSRELQAAFQKEVDKQLLRFREEMSEQEKFHRLELDARDVEAKKRDEVITKQDAEIKKLYGQLKLANDSNMQASDAKRRQKIMTDLEMEKAIEKEITETRKVGKVLERTQMCCRWLAIGMREFFAKFRLCLDQFFEYGRVTYKWLTNMEKGARLEPFEPPVISREHLAAISMTMLGMSPNGNHHCRTDWWHQQDWEQRMLHFCKTNDLFGECGQEYNDAKEAQPLKWQRYDWGFVSREANGETGSEVWPDKEVEPERDGDVAASSSNTESAQNHPEKELTSPISPSWPASVSEDDKPIDEVCQDINDNENSSDDFEGLKSAADEQNQQQVASDENRSASYDANGLEPSEESPSLTFSVPEEDDSDFDETASQHSLSDPSESKDMPSQHVNLGSADVAFSIDVQTTEQLINISSPPSNVSQPKQEAPADDLPSTTPSHTIDDIITSDEETDNVADTAGTSPASPALPSLGDISSTASTGSDTVIAPEQPAKKKSNKKSADRKAKVNQKNYEKKKAAAADMTADQKAAKNAKRREQKARAAERKASASTS